MTGVRLDVFGVVKNESITLTNMDHTKIDGDDLFKFRIADYTYSDYVAYKELVSGKDS